MTALLAMLVAVFAVPASAEDNLTAYAQIQSGSISIRFLAGTDLTAGETYTISAKMKMTDVVPNGGFGYGSWYEFVSTDMSKDANADYEAYGANLGQWKDWQTINADADWTEYSATFTLGANCGHLRVQFGFYLATGTLSIDDIVIKKADGTVVFSEDWEDGFDAKVWNNFDDNGQETVYNIMNYTAPVESKEESKEDNAETGDSAIVFAVLAVISLAGAVIVKKVRQ